MKTFVVFAIALVAGVFAGCEDNEISRLAMENPDLFGGDMAGIDGPFDAERNAMPAEKYRWPAGVVPYIIDDSASTLTNTIQQAIKHYHDKTCVRFVPRTNEKDYVKFFVGNGCYSMIGRVGGQQSLSLGTGCNYVGIVIHELGHALGFYHEHARSDRDDYVFIFLDNVQKGMEHNFAKLSPSQNLLLTPFDYDSIMIYGEKTFSKDGKGQTMMAKNRQRILDSFCKQEMTSSDIQRVRKMYKC